MKKILALVACLSLVASLAIGGSIAYLTDRDSEANIFTVGDVRIDLEETFDQGAGLVPGVKIEKMPVIRNTGDNDAWVWMTWAIPAQLDNQNDAGENMIHWNHMSYTDMASNGNLTDATVEKGIELGYFPEGTTAEGIMNGAEWDLTAPAQTTKINDIEYNVYTFKYQKALVKGEATLPTIWQTYLDANIDIAPDGSWYHVVKGEVGEPVWNSDLGNPVIYVSAYAAQKEGFDTVNDAYAAYNKQWMTTDSNDPKDFVNPELNNGVEYAEPPVSVGSNEEALEALTADKKNIAISLQGDVTYDVAAWQNDAMGGASTETITIIGNGHTITFNQTNSDWSNIVTENGAKLVISDAKITNAGHNDGPWNRHDLNFACDVKLTNVTSDKAMAFKSGAELKNVTISDANGSDTYAIWIQPNGQTVTLDGCTIDMLDCTDGRGIKIDEQYVDDVKKVTLNVSNTTFKTEEKAAIIVKSQAGADIKLNKVDISGVAADSTNAVWVDEASAAYADLVTVAGGSKIVEL